MPFSAVHQNIPLAEGMAPLLPPREVQSSAARREGRNVSVAADSIMRAAKCSLLSPKEVLIIPLSFPANRESLISASSETLTDVRKDASYLNAPLKKKKR